MILCVAMLYDSAIFKVLVCQYAQMMGGYWSELSGLYGYITIVPIYQVVFTAALCNRQNDRFFNISVFPVDLKHQKVDRMAFG